jgi:hypothetical protein
MADKWIRSDLAHMLQRPALADRITLARWALSAAVSVTVGTTFAPRADFDPAAYLANMTTRPAYTSATADQDPIRGHSLCDRVFRFADWMEDHLATATFCCARSAAAG